MRPETVTVADRLRALPRTGLPLDKPVQIHWNDHQVPFIEAGTDHDAAVSLGLVHVHLRWAQMELMRHVAQGRVSELAGPFGLGMDRMLRTLDLTRAVPAIAASLPAETRGWAEAFLQGVNHAVTHLPAVPPEFRLLGLRRTPWSMHDLLSVGRLAALDVTWMVWLALLPQWRTPGLATLWRGLFGADAALDVAGDTTASGTMAGLRRLLMRFARSGSNSWAVGPSRTGGSGAWIASDTHLGALLPNLWLLAGYRSPSFHVVGLMVPGLPVVAVGRNPSIAWGGTNLHAASSDLFDVADLGPDQIRTRHERVRIRFLGSRRIAVRDSPLGPVITDLRSMRRSGLTAALHWMGHRPSDELTALLRLNRAHDWDGFRAALEGLAVPGQNMVFAAAAGHIGKIMAAHLPARPVKPPASLVLPREEANHWQQIVTSRDLPFEFDPPRGFVASANDKPPDGPVRVGYFFSSSHRIKRLAGVLSRTDPIDRDTLVRLQQDVLVTTAPPVAERLAVALRELNTAAGARLASAMAGWDGEYQAGSAAPLAFELLLFHLGLALHGRKMLGVYSASWNARALLSEQLLRLPPDRLRALLRRTVSPAAAGLARFRTWGAMHRLEPRHVLAAIPGLGRRFRFAEWATGGGGDTVMKTANALTPRRHRAALASTARHISNLADPDANWFVLLGGQDGWLGSTTLLDQTRLWREGTYIQMPLTPEAVRAQFPHRVDLRP